MTSLDVQLKVKRHLIHPVLRRIFSVHLKTAEVNTRIEDEERNQEFGDVAQRWLSFIPARNAEVRYK